MTTAAPPAVGADSVPTVSCRACDHEVPAGVFCGNCGARLADERGDGLGRLRIGAYAIAPEEHVLVPFLGSSLFPQLPRRSRTPFRLGLAVILLLAVAFAVLRWQAPLIAVCALGLPVLFSLYGYEADIHRDLPRRTLATATTLAIGLGVGWALFTGRLATESFDVSLRSGTAHSVMFFNGPLITACGALVMFVPTVVVRILRPPTRESLDGYVIGALTAISFTAATTLTRLAPQLMTGPMAEDRPVSGLVVQAGVQGIAVPLTTAAIGGLVGAALWFMRPANPSGWRDATGALAAIGVAFLFFGGLGLMERVPLPEGVHVGVHLLFAAAAVVALRICLQASVLHEAHDTMDPAGHLMCPHCEHLVPDMAFCSRCGVAARAASRTSRAARRSADARQQSATAAIRRITPTRMVAALGATLAVLAVVATVVSVAVTPEPPKYVCPPDCGEPPFAKPVETNPRFIARDGSFSVSYPPEGSAYDVTFAPDGVTLDFVASDTGTLDLWGEPAKGRSPERITEDVIDEWYPDAVTEYEIPNAMVGYEPGYGVVADDYPNDSTGTYTRLRLVVMVAVKNDLALVAAAIGPYHEFSPGFGTGHPSAANLELAMDMGKYVNSFTWSER